MTASLGNPAQEERDVDLQLVPRQFVPSEIREAFPEARMFLRTGAHFGTDDLCGGGFHGPTDTEGRQDFFDWYLQAPARYSLRRGDKVKRLEASYDEEWFLGCPDHRVGPPCHSTVGKLDVKVKFVWFPRRQLQAQIASIRKLGK